MEEEVFDPHEILTLSDKELLSDRSCSDEESEYNMNYDDVSSMLLTCPEVETHNILRKRRRNQIKRLYCGFFCKILLTLYLLLWCIVAIVITFLWIFLYD